MGIFRLILYCLRLSLSDWSDQTVDCEERCRTQKPPNNRTDNDTTETTHQLTID